MSLKNIKENLLKNDNFRKSYYGRHSLAFEVAEMVRSERINSGLTQGELAKLLKTKQSSISRLESGNLSPSLNFLERIAEVLNVQLLPPRFLSISKKKSFVLMGREKKISFLSRTRLAKIEKAV
jgi:transcriptional regulator with XRE-family HTH domain